MELNRRIVVIGASAGGVAALQRLVAGLPADFPAPILVVLHIGTHRSVLPELLNARGPLTARFAVDGVTPEAGFIEVAPADHHLVLEDNQLRLLRGAKEHHARPAIDPLFRSAALNAGSAVIGVVLTGMLDDGAAGLHAIHACGGTTVIQAPEDAEEASMPLSAMSSTCVDHVVALDQLAALLNVLAQPQQGAWPILAPAALRMEHAVSRGNASIEQLESVATPSGLSCPDCGGALFAFKGHEIRYRCHTGHAFGLRSLLAAQERATDRALWSALRALHEKEAILRGLALHQGAVQPGSQESTVDDAARVRAFGGRLRALILELPSTNL